MLKKRDQTDEIQIQPERSDILGAQFDADGTNIALNSEQATSL